MIRNISIRDDIVQVMTQYVRALPDVFTEFDITKVELVPELVPGEDFILDIVCVENEDEELLIGEAILTGDFELYVEIFED